ncbi:hypothetical protein AZE42_12614 [Rhizopogon vesiculosus]|uniref:Uncharacterized protein n=1 Tax=Rhizopogon vesiculosus TaxID=180088 RepID=A0A1J8PL93_9AGAM|nr:hypothetical protein AZE42_12614 [Rhizopogon vesiculosus]
MGCAVLSHLRNLVACIAHSLQDEQQKPAPYGIEFFGNVLKPLWLGIRLHRRKGLTAFLEVIGFIISLMDPEMKKNVLKVML